MAARRHVYKAALAALALTTAGLVACGDDDDYQAAWLEYWGAKPTS